MNRWKYLATLVALAMTVSLVGLVGAAGGPEVEAVPTFGKPVAPGVKLWVFVFPAPARPSPYNKCDDGDQDGFKLHDFSPNAGGLTFNITDGSIPTYLDSTAAVTAITSSFNAWDSETSHNLFTVSDSGGASRPAQDGNNSVGWAFIVPTRVLAAAWVWEVDGVVDEADIFFNNWHEWGVFTGCNDEAAFEVGNVGTHEVGHVAGVAHNKDKDGHATMYPSAPSGEVKKRSLTTGDIAGLQAALGGGGGGGGNGGGPPCDKKPDHPKCS